LSTILEAGIYHQVKNKWVPKTYSSTCKGSSEGKGLGIDDVYTVFVFMAVAVLICIVIVLFETLVFLKLH
jgi:ABC-type multidrug transport system permease subunit